MHSFVCPAPLCSRFYINSILILIIITVYSFIFLESLLNISVSAATKATLTIKKMALWRLVSVKKDLDGVLVVMSNPKKKVSQSFKIALKAAAGQRS